MSRRALAALTVVVLLAAGGCVAEQTTTEPPAVRASPQLADLDWVEPFEATGGRITFRVQRFEVLEDGWRAAIGIDNETTASWAMGDLKATLDRMFGVMLFRTGDLDELEQRNESGSLPGVRRAERYEPALPALLEPDDSWSGVISAGGALAAGRFVRVVFGTLVPVGDPPEGFPGRLVWITDNAYELQP